MSEDFVPLAVFLRRTPTSASGAVLDADAMSRTVPPSVAADPRSLVPAGVAFGRQAADALSQRQSAGVLSERQSGDTLTEPQETRTNAIARVSGDLALMRLAACECFERAAREMLLLFAREILGRELALAPGDVAALVSRAVASFAELEPLHVVVSPADEGRAASIPLPVRTDPELAAGDFIIGVRDGALESQLSFRLQAIVELVQPSVPAQSCAASATA